MNWYSLNERIQIAFFRSIVNRPIFITFYYTYQKKEFLPSNGMKLYLSMLI